MRRTAFTLVELLIVVIILGILAAVVVPQFSTSSDDAKEASVMTNLQTIRGQIELYKMQHDGSYPTNAASFPDQMTMTSDVGGNTANSGFGPYLSKIPPNPYIASGTPNEIAATADGSSAWYYLGNASDGKFGANDGIGGHDAW